MRTEPSSTASTFRARAISGTVLPDPLNCVVDVREMTLSPPRWPSVPINSSVMPSAKYSCAGSPDRFASGSTAIDRTAPGGTPPDEAASRNPSRRSAGQPTNAITSAAAIDARISPRRAQRRAETLAGSAAFGAPVLADTGGALASPSVSTSAASNAPAVS